ncbi:MAG: EAL domain-containing protein [Polyangiaceae bacterium]|nr:EAL domain-containing protein [Myxococcales bacterium]MCB9585735.1 EAL domain-containing protein [Polyangiaceae bacterium]MCB9607336.1 EAL domain-containing protein [Polyangiaceae bacterium]
MPEDAATREKTRVLVVDDERFIREVLADFLGMEGYQVRTAEDGAAASRELDRSKYDVVITDLKMPNMGGLDLLREIERKSPDAVTIVMTGFGTVETAIDAMKRGAHDYVLKPFKVEQVLEIVRQGLEARSNGTGPHSRRAQVDSARKELSERFSRMMDTLWLAYHPIVTVDGNIYGYEALMRSEEPSFPDPSLVLSAAEDLDQLHALGRRIRDRAVEGFKEAPEGSHLFVNLHPADLMDSQLFSPTAPLSKIAPRVVLEITERASLEKLDDVPGRVASLRALGFRVAIDDLGAGYAGLGSFTELEPDIVKLDMSLVRGVHLHRTKEKVILSMMSLARELGTTVVAEGVETEEERAKLTEIGCDLLQGFFFAKPRRLSRR